MNQFLFQYCQKIVIFSKDYKSILLCKRQGENDYDGVYSFAGGKMKTSDLSIQDGLQREKNEELGERFKIQISLDYSSNVFFQKKDGNSMILPHYYAIHESGDISLNEEYSEYKWIKISELNSFEPKISTIPDMVKKFLKLKETINNDTFIMI